MSKNTSIHQMPMSPTYSIVTDQDCLTQKPRRQARKCMSVSPSLQNITSPQTHPKVPSKLSMDQLDHKVCTRLHSNALSCAAPSWFGFSRPKHFHGHAGALLHQFQAVAIRPMTDTCNHEKKILLDQLDQLDHVVQRMTLDHRKEVENFTLLR